MAEVFDHFVVSVIERLSATDESCSSSPMLCTPVGVPRIGFQLLAPEQGVSNRPDSQVRIGLTQ